MVEIERFALRAAILHELAKLLRGRGRFGRKREKSPPPPRAIIPGARPLGTYTFENQEGHHYYTVRRAISRRSHEKIGDCDLSGRAYTK